MANDPMRQTLTPRAMDFALTLMLSRADRAALNGAGYDVTRDLFEVNLPARRYRTLVRRLRAHRVQASA